MAEAPAETDCEVGVGVTEKPGTKFAPTFWALVTVMLQVEVPEQGPFQPVKTEPDIGAAESVTVLPSSNAEEHALGQVIPEGVLVTLPDPVRFTDNAGPAQEGKLKDAILVDQLLPVLGIYSVENQNVQSSVGSIAMVL